MRNTELLGFCLRMLSAGLLRHYFLSFDLIDSSSTASYLADDVNQSD